MVWNALRRLAPRQCTSVVASKRWLCAAASNDCEAQARQELGKRAHREVQIARRRRREADDELVLFQSASAAGFVCREEDSEDEGKRRRRVIDRFLTARAEEIMSAIAAKTPLHQVVDFTLEVAPSQKLPQPIAGDGLFIKDAARGEVPPGTLLAFYPGSVYLPHEVRWCGGDRALLDRAGQPTSSHVIGRVGGVLIDGLWSGFEVPVTEYDLSAEAFQEALEVRMEREGVTSDKVRDAAQADLQAFCEGLRSGARRTNAPVHAGMPERVRALNPLAVGEMINHPPNGSPANVMGWPVDLDLVGRGNEYIAPNTFALRPEGEQRPGAPSSYTVVMVAAQTLHPGDELYLDYGCELLEPDEIPVWFAPATLRGDANAEDPRVAPALAIRDELHAWRRDFENSRGRKPTRHDMFSDEVAAALFETFQKYRKLGDL